MKCDLQDALQGRETFCSEGIFDHWTEFVVTKLNEFNFFVDLRLVGRKLMINEAGKFY